MSMVVTALNTRVSKRCQMEQTDIYGTTYLSDLSLMSKTMQNTRSEREKKQESRSGPPLYAVGERVCRSHWLQLN